MGKQMLRELKKGLLKSKLRQHIKLHKTCVCVCVCICVCVCWFKKTNNALPHSTALKDNIWVIYSTQVTKEELLRKLFSFNMPPHKKGQKRA